MSSIQKQSDQTLSRQETGLTKSLILKEQDKYAVLKDLALKLQRLSKLYAIKDHSEEQSVYLAQWIYENYLYDTLGIIQRVLEKPPITPEKVWRLTPDTINEWMSVELEHESKEREIQINNEKFKKIDNEWTPEQLKEWEAILSQAGPSKPIPTLTQEDIEREGQEKPVRPRYHPPTPEYIILHQLHLQWIRENYDPITGKPKETWLSEDEWLKTQNP